MKRRWVQSPLLLLLLLLPLLGIASYNYWAISQELTQGALAKRAAIADLAALVLQEKFDHLKDLGVSLAERPLLRQWVEEGNWNQTEQMLQALLKDFPMINRFVLVDPSGTNVMDTPAIPLVRGQNFAYRDWFKGVSKNWQPYLSEIFSRVPEPHEHQVGVAVPIRSETGRVVGVLQLQELADPFFAWSQEVEVGPAGFVYFVDQHGNLTGHPKFSAQGEIINFSKVPAVQRVLQGKKGAEVFFDPVEKQELVLAYEPVPGYGWGVIVQQAAAFAFTQRQRS
ncbi:MAG: cache domain-containing protein, partial [Elusimicrobia bacterium]|nr:cache domain-containing protein [Elusimicrobiota bacterium]